MRSRPRRARHFPRRPSKIAIRRGNVRRGGGSRVEMVRRRRVRRGVDDSFDPDDLPVEPTTDEDVDADVLRMMFSCCHPTLTEDTQTARLPARMSPHALLPLEEQDRAAWDGDLVRLGITHLAASASGSELTVFHLEAGIAPQHAVASSVETTDWSEIARLYDLLYAKKPTPVVALSRAIARSRVLGAQTGLEEILGLEGRERLDASP